MDDKKDLTERTLSVNPIFQGRVISLQVEQVRLPDGRITTREVIKHPGAVAIIAVTGEDKLLVVEQYRKPLERLQVEIPAGKLEAGEPPEEAAKRELQEETGYACERVVPLYSAATSPGFADEVVHLFVAEGLKPGAASPDKDEFIASGSISLEEAERYIAEGRICDAKTLLAIYAWKLHRLSGHWRVNAR